MAGIDWSGSVSCKVGQKITETEGEDKLTNSVKHSMTIKAKCTDDTYEDIVGIFYEKITDDEPTISVTVEGTKTELDNQLKEIGTAISKLGGQKTLDF